jgi:hypothetical protein
MTVINNISFPVKISSTTYWKLFYNLTMRFITKIISRFLIRNSRVQFLLFFCYQILNYSICISLMISIFTESKALNAIQININFKILFYEKIIYSAYSYFF